MSKKYNCTECGKETEWYRGRPRIVCSKECEKIRRSIRGKKFYWDHKAPEKICKYWKCDKRIYRQGKKPVYARKFCTLLCYKLNKHSQQKYQRIFDKHLSLIKMGLLVRRNN